MDDSIAAMKTALRVLTAIIEKRTPETTDIEPLRQMALLPADAPLDEVACEVIQQAVRIRAADREKTRGRVA
jgi:hypothetical protein